MLRRSLGWAAVVSLLLFAGQAQADVAPVVPTCGGSEPPRACTVDGQQEDGNRTCQECKATDKACTDARAQQGYSLICTRYEPDPSDPEQRQTLELQIWCSPAAESSGCSMASVAAPSSAGLLLAASLWATARLKRRRR